MKEVQAINAFAAISQETRLRIIRLLVVTGANGLAAGESKSDERDAQSFTALFSQHCLISLRF